MESYKEHLADSTKVAMIHVSYDEQEADALSWAIKEGFPWLTVLSSKLEEADLEKFAGDFVPEYLLLSPDGKVLASGKDECLKRIAALNDDQG